MTGVTATLAAVTAADLDTAEAYELWRLRQQVFVVEQQSPYADLDGRDLDPTTRHVLAHSAGTLVGCLRVVENPDHLRIGRVVAAAEARGSGLGRRLLTAGLDLCAGREVRLDAQTHLAAFYGSFGFEVSGPEYDEDGIMHVPMCRAAQTGGATS